MATYSEKLTLILTLHDPRISEHASLATATYLQYRVIGLTSIVVGLAQSLAQRSGTVSRISSGTRQSAPTLSDVC